MTPKTMGKIDRMVSATSLTESSIPPICANRGYWANNENKRKETVFFIRMGCFFIGEKYHRNEGILL